MDTYIEKYNLLSDADNIILTFEETKYKVHTKVILSVPYFGNLIDSTEITELQEINFKDYISDISLFEKFIEIIYLSYTKTIENYLLNIIKIPDIYDFKKIFSFFGMITERSILDKYVITLLNIIDENIIQSIINPNIKHIYMYICDDIYMQSLYTFQNNIKRISIPEEGLIGNIFNNIRENTNTIIDIFDYYDEIATLLNTNTPIKCYKWNNKPDNITHNILNKSEFCKKFSEYSYGLLDDLDWSGFVVAGGCIYRILTDKPAQPYSDIDIYIYGDYDMREYTFKRIVEHFSRHQNTVYFGSIGCVAYIFIAGINRMFNIINSSDYITEKDVIAEYDFSHVKMFYNGTTVNASTDAVFSLLTNITIPYKTPKLHRIYKTFINGLSIMKNDNLNIANLNCNNMIDNTTYTININNMMQNKILQDKIYCYYYPSINNIEQNKNILQRQYNLQYITTDYKEIEYHFDYSSKFGEVHKAYDRNKKSLMIYNGTITGNTITIHKSYSYIIDILNNKFHLNNIEICDVFDQFIKFVVENKNIDLNGKISKLQIIPKYIYVYNNILPYFTIVNTNNENKDGLQIVLHFVIPKVQFKKSVAKMEKIKPMEILSCELFDIEKLDIDKSNFIDKEKTNMPYIFFPKYKYTDTYINCPYFQTEFIKITHYGTFNPYGRMEVPYIIVPNDPNQIACKKLFDMLENINKFMIDKIDYIRELLPKRKKEYNYINLVKKPIEDDEKKICKPEYCKFNLCTFLGKTIISTMIYTNDGGKIKKHDIKNFTELSKILHINSYARFLVGLSSIWVEKEEKCRSMKPQIGIKLKCYQIEIIEDNAIMDNIYDTYAFNNKTTEKKICNLGEIEQSLENNSIVDATAEYWETSDDEAVSCNLVYSDDEC